MHGFRYVGITAKYIEYFFDDIEPAPPKFSSSTTDWPVCIAQFPYFGSQAGFAGNGESDSRYEYERLTD
ncbi:hypothetical protein AWH04_17565 [Rhodococcus erythropolis]|nr:hypothetical protein A5N83_23440 [Rhodococcus sp. 1139]RGP50554.1 hypothetical protein AWH04_17565 [Rhodococcus erythropolis]